MSAETLAAALDALMFDQGELTRMSTAARAWAPFDAREKQLDVLAEFLPERGEIA
jgi:UDP-N-acetylglucosamine--N-acetylmuramyl-(pentapeptide) pyrophosphoryl-undecaprenol N-acetylglucosamine transferase